MDAQRRLLAELMGTATQGINDFKDERVCKFFLIGMCPHELFPNTEHDLGPCTKVHDENFKKQYEEAAKARDFGYERDLERILDQMVSKNDRKIAKGLARVEEEEGGAGGTISRVDVERLPELAEISKQIDDMLKAAEAAGENGEVAKSMQLTEQAELLKRQKAERQAQLLVQSAAKDDNSLTTKANIRNHQKLRVCDICGSFLSLLDSDERLADHFGGRVHLGWANVRARLAEIRDRRRQTVAPPPAAASCANAVPLLGQEAKRERSRSPDRAAADGAQAAPAAAGSSSSSAPAAGGAAASTWQHSSYRGGGGGYRGGGGGGYRGGDSRYDYSRERGRDDRGGYDRRDDRGGDRYRDDRDRYRDDRRRERSRSRSRERY